MRIPGLFPSYRTALTITGGDVCQDPGLELNDELRVTFARVPPPVYRVYGKEGLVSVIFLPFCGILTKDAIRCDICGCLILVSQFNRTSCKARLTLLAHVRSGRWRHGCPPWWSRQHGADFRACVRARTLLHAR
jgi:hypothetical protein